MTTEAQLLAARRELSAMSLELRLQVVCRGCGEQLIPDVPARVTFLRAHMQMDLQCLHCGSLKTPSYTEAA